MTKRSLICKSDRLVTYIPESEASLTVPTPAVAWFEITGKDGPALQQFYGRLFDWSVQDAGDGSGYGLVQAADKGIGGGIGAAQDGGPGQVSFYVEVDDPPPTSRKLKRSAARPSYPQRRSPSSD